MKLLAIAKATNAADTAVERRKGLIAELAASAWPMIADSRSLVQHSARSSLRRLDDLLILRVPDAQRSRAAIIDDAVRFYMGRRGLDPRLPTMDDVVNALYEIWHRAIYLDGDRPSGL